MSNVWDQDDDWRDSPVERDENGNWVDAEQGGPPMNQPAPARPRAPAKPPVAQNPRQRPAAPVRPTKPAEPELKYDEEAITSPEEDDFTEVLSDASLRLEQGNLYKLIMNNNLFAGADADPRAVKNVEREIKRFARQRMEVMLGMRQERSAEAPQVMVSSPFNSLEVHILKQVAAAASKGATERPEAEQIAKKIEKTILSPISVPKSKVLATPTPASDVPTKAQVDRVHAPGPQPLARKPEPLDRSKKINLHDMESSGRGLSPKQAEQLVDHVMDGSGVDIDKMSDDERVAYNLSISERRQARAKNPKAKPTPSVEQTNMIYTQQAGDPKMNQTIAALMGLMKK